MNEKFTVDYFIEKFGAIPDDRWITGNLHYDGKCCVYGHCGMRNGICGNTPESRALYELMLTVDGVYPIQVNDGKNPRYTQPTPRARILAALADIKALAKSNPDSKP